MKFQSLILTLNCIVLIPSFSFGIGGDQEIYCRTQNINETDTVYFYLKSDGPVWEHRPYYISTEYNGYSLIQSDTFVVGNDPNGWLVGWDNLVVNGAHLPPYMSYGIYEITIRKNKDGDEISFSIDFRDDAWATVYPCGRDIYIYYSGDDSIYIYPGGSCDNVTVTNGASYTLWGLKGKASATTDSLELYLTISTQNNHPYLTWNSYAQRSGNNNVDYYEIWKNESSSWSMKDTTSDTYYEDTSEDATPPGVKKYIYYKIRAIELDEDESFFGNTAKKAVYDPKQEQKILPGNTPSVNAIPKMFALKQNYPNPFNPTTTISFDLPKESFVNLQFYDIQGKVVSTLIDQTMDEGSHSVNFNSDGLPSGIYFYRLKTSEFSDIKRMLIVK